MLQIISVNQSEKEITKVQDYLKTPNESSLFLKETTPHEVNQILLQMD